MTNYTCKGSFALGTACGDCSKCQAEMDSRSIKAKMRDSLNTPSSALREIRELKARVSELEEAISAMPDTKWQASDGDTRCQKCAVSNPVWHAPNKVWNRIVGGPDAIDDPAGVLCPNCFMAMSDEMWVVAPKAAMPDTTAQADTIKALTKALEICRDELDAYSRQEYPSDHSVHERYRQRDYDANPARAALAIVGETA